MLRTSKAQKDTIERVMHEFKEGDLRIGGNGPRVKNPKQAIAIALREAGASNRESPAENRENLRKTKAKERKGPASPRERLAAARRPAPSSMRKPASATSRAARG